MLEAVLNTLFPCVHRRTTFPQTHSRAPAGTPPGTYVACLDCGREIPYDWESMRVRLPAHLATGTTGEQRLWRHGGSKASNAAHTTADSQFRHYVGRAALPFRKMKVALRVLNSLMTGAVAQPDDVALLASWAGADNRTRSPEEMAR
jgi:hypothetical protein